MSNIISTHSTNNFVGIYENSGAKEFHSIFWVDNINFASPDYCFPKLDFVFPFLTM